MATEYLTYSATRASHPVRGTERTTAETNTGRRGQVLALFNVFDSKISASTKTPAPNDRQRARRIVWRHHSIERRLATSASINLRLGLLYVCSSRCCAATDKYTPAWPGLSMPLVETTSIIKSYISVPCLQKLS